MTKFNENDILKLLDTQYLFDTSVDFSNGHVISSIFFPCLGDFYLKLAGSRIHLYTNNTNWAIVFELNGYNIGDYSLCTNLYYIGDYLNLINEVNGVTYKSNIISICHLTYNEIDSKICYDNEDHCAELRKNHDKCIELNGISISIDDNIELYESKGIMLEFNSKMKKIILIEDIIRYIWETNKEALLLKDDIIKQHLFPDMEKIMTIDQFHYKEDFCYKESLPSKHELFQLIAKVLSTKDTSMWKPTEKPNNHWKNWLYFE